jgi:hypothetical protein
MLTRLTRWLRSIGIDSVLCASHEEVGVVCATSVVSSLPLNDGWKSRFCNFKRAGALTRPAAHSRCHGGEARGADRIAAHKPADCKPSCLSGVTPVPSTCLSSRGANMKQHVAVTISLAHEHRSLALHPELTRRQLRCRDIRQQFQEILSTFAITAELEDVLSRCTKCNGDFVQ